MVRGPKGLPLPRGVAGESESSVPRRAYERMSIGAAGITAAMHGAVSTIRSKATGRDLVRGGAFVAQKTVMQLYFAEAEPRDWAPLPRVTSGAKAPARPRRMPQCPTWRPRAQLATQILMTLGTHSVANERAVPVSPPPRGSLAIKPLISLKSGSTFERRIPAATWPVHEGERAMSHDTGNSTRPFRAMPEDGLMGARGRRVSVAHPTTPVPGISAHARHAHRDQGQLLPGRAFSVSLSNRLSQKWPNCFATVMRAIMGSSGCWCTSAIPTGAVSISDRSRET